MAIDLKQAIIHSIAKARNTTVITAIVKKTTLLDVTDPAVASLVSGVNSLLGNPGNLLSYGQFGNDMREGRFPGAFGDYVPKSAKNDAFLELSHCAVDQLADRAREEPFATGGHILVAAYESDTRPFLLVAMIKQRGGIVLDDDYVPKTIQEVDMSKVHQAARINITRYKEVVALGPVAEDDDAPEDRTYLSFVGAKTDPAAGYFVTALGCTKGIASSRATSNVIAAVEAFFTKPELKKYRTEAKNAVTSYLQEKLASGHDAVLSDIAFCATSGLKDKQEEVVEEFRVYLNSEQVKVPAAFPVHRTTLNKSTRIKAETGSWTVQFEKRLLGSSPNSPIYFDPKKKTLTLTGVSEDIAKEIQAELDSRKT